MKINKKWWESIEIDEDLKKSMEIEKKPMRAYENQRESMNISGHLMTIKMI
jgi:hypothetical protein